MKKNKTWVITDTHFGHKLLIKYGRPEDFESELLVSLMSIKPGDTLIHLGDVCIGDDSYWNEKIMKSLVGVKKVLVLGNHDGKSYSWYMDHGWDFACDGFKWERYGKKIWFSHIPIKKREDIDINIHGHCHGNNHRDADLPGPYDQSWHYDVAPELRGYKPLSLENIVI